MRALVLEGGAMRGIFTAGVLDAMAGSSEPPFDLVVGVSAGACCAASYLSGQVGRNRRIFLERMATRRFASPVRFALGGSLVDMDYLMGPVTLELDPLDVEAVRSSPSRLVAVTTHARTAEPCYLPAQGPDCLDALLATVAMPFFFKNGPVRFRGEDHFDGGVADPVPVSHAVSQGATDLTVVVTRPPSWRPPPLSRISRLFLSFALSRYPLIPPAIAARPAAYERARAALASPPPGVRIRLVAPPDDFPVTRFTMDRSLLERGYDMGLEAARRP